MFKLVVVLPMVLAAVSAAGIHPLSYGAVAPGFAYSAPYAYNAAVKTVAAAPIAYAAAPAVTYAAAAPVVKTYAAAPLVQTYAAAPVVKTYAAAPVVQTYAAAPVVQTVQVPVTKTVHYENRPVVTGYTSQILKPAFPGGAGLATPAEIVSKTPVLAPARSVQTVIPQVTRVEPEVAIQKVAVDVPVAKPYPVEQVVRTVAQPVVAAPIVKHVAAAPVVQTYAAAPAVATYAAAPAVATYAAAPVVKTFAAAPAVATYAAAPAVATYAAGPAVATYAAGPAVATYAAAPALAYNAGVKTIATGPVAYSAVPAGWK